MKPKGLQESVKTPSKAPFKVLKIANNYYIYGIILKPYLLCRHFYTAILLYWFMFCCCLWWGLPSAPATAASS